MRNAMIRLGASATLGAVLLTGCTSASEASPDPSVDVGLTLRDGWAKAADDGMTPVFGVLENPGAEDVVLVEAECDASVVEFHEMAAGDGGGMTMREKDGGVRVPAGGEYALEAGGDHIMLMDLRRPIEPGDVIVIILIDTEGVSVDVDVVVKDFAGGDEAYESD